jgi:hypothetical protein
MFVPLEVHAHIQISFIIMISQHLVLRKNVGESAYDIPKASWHVFRGKGYKPLSIAFYDTGK